MIAAIISTTPIMLNTWLPVDDTFITALKVEFCNDVEACAGVTVGMLLIVMKKAKTPTARIMRAITADMI